MIKLNEKQSFLLEAPMKRFFLLSILFLTHSTYCSIEVLDVMDSIFEQHLTQKSMTPELMQNSIENFINEFDPLKAFLLQNEVDPYISLSHSQLKAAIKDYQRADFGIFEQLITLFQKALTRSQQFRTRFKNQNAISDSDRLTTLFNEYKSRIERQNTQKFAQSMQELEERSVAYMLTFLYQTHTYDQHQAKQFNLEAHLKKLRDKEEFYSKLNTSSNTQSNQEKLNLIILKAMTSALDSHSLIFSDLEARDMEMRLQTEFKGVGIVFSDSTEGAFVESVLPNSPAFEIGKIKEGDRLVGVNQTEISQLPFKEAMEILRKAQDKVDLTFETASGKLYTVTITKTLIALEQDRLKYKTYNKDRNRYGIIQLHSFYDNFKGTATSNDLINALQAMSSTGQLDGLILDLRQNTGGYLKQAILVSGLFISNGVIAISKYSNGEEVVLRDTDPNDYFDGPLIILTSKISASAAEIVAQTLQDYGVALVVGDKKTFGKGTIQIQNVTHKMSQQLPQLKITVGEYYTVSGRSTQLVGVTPDIYVPSFLDNEPIGEEHSPNPVPNSQIKAFYLDPLDDVYGPHRTWFINNYLPTIQIKERHWKNLVPTLKSNSKLRIQNSTRYQSFLKDHSKFTTFEDIIEQPIESAIEKDLQLQEAIYILDDMSNLSKRY